MGIFNPKQRQVGRINNLWYLINDLINTGESFIIATLFGKTGSAPRENGAKMIIYADGSITGTIGGGLLEAEVRELACQVFETKIPRVHRFNFSAAEIAETNMICGGKCDVLLDYVPGPNPPHQEIYSSIINALNKHECARLVTSIGLANSKQIIANKCLVNANGNIIGQLGYEFADLNIFISETAKTDVHIFNNQRFLVEPVHGQDWLYIFGAGHIAKQLAILAAMADFKTVVIDDRFEYASKERFPDSDLVVLDSFEALLLRVQINQEGYLVIATRGHMYDKTVLEQVLKTPSAYVGMIASQRKRRLIYETLQAEKGFEARDFIRVHSPIGLEIRAETPEEIAISIIAELIKVRAERKHAAKDCGFNPGGRLFEPHGRI